MYLHKNNLKYRKAESNQIKVTLYYELGQSMDNTEQGSTKSGAEHLAYMKMQLRAFTFAYMQLIFQFSRHQASHTGAQSSVHTGALSSVHTGAKGVSTQEP